MNFILQNLADHTYNTEENLADHTILSLHFCLFLIVKENRQDHPIFYYDQFWDSVLNISIISSWCLGEEIISTLLKTKVLVWDWIWMGGIHRGGTIGVATHFCILLDVSWGQRLCCVKQTRPFLLWVHLGTILLLKMRRLADPAGGPESVVTVSSRY